MDQSTTFAFLAAASYDDARIRADNRAPVPQGWRLLPEFSVSGSGTNASLIRTGFTARVFQGPTGEVVISYAGTEFGGSTAGLVNDFAQGNIPLALGLFATQALQAALLYERVQARYGANANISFTGHSLGGGLAGLMAVWFDRPATVFDPAPFEAAASSLSPALIQTRALLGLAGYQDPKFNSYLSLTDFSGREARVSSFAISGEILESIPLLARIETNRAAYLAGAAPALSGGDKHSIDLLAAVMMLSSFKGVAAALPELLPAMFDATLFGYKVLSSQPNFLMRLLRNEVGIYNAVDGTQVSAPNGLLAKFSADVQKLTPTVGSAAQSLMRTALIAADMEYFYLKDPASTSALFSTNGNGIHFKLTDIDARTDAVTGILKSSRLLAGVAWSLEAANGDVAQVAAGRVDAWHVQTGTDAMTWMDAAGLDDAAIGGTQGDSLDGGAGSDLLMGLAGDDTLTGGANDDTLFGGGGNDSLTGGLGHDRLYGGAGTDTYTFSGSFGSDTIEDSGGDGVIEVTGLGPLTALGAKKSSTTNTSWQSDDKRISYSLVSVGTNRQDLVITVAANTNIDTNVGSITIRNWLNGQLGITLGTDVVQPATTNTFAGDYAKATNFDGTQYLVSTLDGNYISAGPQIDAADVLDGTIDADVLRGQGGNDGLAGHGGDDVIEGGDGADLLLGGRGFDTISGGAGNDIIFGSAIGPIAQPTSTSFTPPAVPVGNVEQARGFSWVAYRAAGNRIDGDTAKFFYSQVNGASNLAGLIQVGAEYFLEGSGNTIDGGAGNDFIAAGSGPDVVHGGADDDDIVGLGLNDVLYGDDGADYIWGDGSSDPAKLAAGAYWYIDPAAHGNDVLVGGAGNDVLVGQGGDDELYGGTEDDWLWATISNSSIRRHRSTAMTTWMAVQETT